MPDVSELFSGKYIKGEDYPKPTVLTIAGADVQSFKKKGEEGVREKKLVLHFTETDKSMIVNKSNFFRLQAITGSPDTDNWAGKEITVFNDLTVQRPDGKFGGLRIKMPVTADNNGNSLL